MIDFILLFLSVCLSTTPERKQNKIVFNISLQRLIAVTLIIILLRLHS